MNKDDFDIINKIESTPKSHQHQKCFFWRYFHFTQLADAKASPNLLKYKYLQNNPFCGNCYFPEWTQTLCLFIEHIC